MDFNLKKMSDCIQNINIKILSVAKKTTWLQESLVLCCYQSLFHRKFNPTKNGKITILDMDLSDLCLKHASVRFFFQNLPT